MLDLKSAYDFVQERLGVDLRSADASAELASLGVDSLSLLELLFEIEEKLGVRVEEEVPPPRTVGELARMLERIVAGKSPVSGS